MKYLEPIAFWLIMMFAAMADGIADTLGAAGFLAVAVVVLAVASLMVWFAQNFEVRHDG